MKSTPEPAKRGDKGHFAAGVSGNPAGRPASGMQGMSDRIANFWMNKTVEEVERLVKNPKLWKKLASIDAAIARRASEAQKKTGINDMVVLLQYMVGKPVQPVSGEFKVTHGLADRINKARKQLQPTTIDQLSAPALTTAMPIAQSIAAATEDN